MSLLLCFNYYSFTYLFSYLGLWLQVCLINPVSKKSEENTWKLHTATFIITWLQQSGCSPHLWMCQYGTSRRRRDDVGNGLRPDRRLWDGLFRPIDVVCLQGCSLFSIIFNGLLFGWTLWKVWMYWPNLKSVAFPVPKIIGGTRKKLGRSWIRPRSLFSKMFNGLLFGWNKSPLKIMDHLNVQCTARIWNP